MSASTRSSALELFVSTLMGVTLLSGEVRAQPTGEPTPPKVALGLRASLGGRFDDVRMCVATPAGTQGGPAMDVSFYVERTLGQRWSVAIDVPVFRPVLFGVAFRMLQFEPEVTFGYRIALKGKVDVIVGPSLGLTLHYGPDYRSPRARSDRGPSFFAMGPRMGVYLGLDFKRPGKRFDFQLGLRPYVTPLFGIDDPANHRGVVVGGQLEALFRFSLL
jgi:hypothetical protein